MYKSPIVALRLPQSETKRTAPALAYGRDGYRLLDTVAAPGWLRELPAVEALRRIWVQVYYRVIATTPDTSGGKLIRREATEQGLPPGRSKLVSPYDLDARYSEERGAGWTGYKVHVTETCTTPRRGRPHHRPSLVPNLITGVATTAATAPDAAMTRPIHDTLAGRPAPQRAPRGRRLHLR